MLWYEHAKKHKAGEDDNGQPYPVVHAMGRVRIEMDAFNIAKEQKAANTCHCFNRWVTLLHELNKNQVGYYERIECRIQQSAQGGFIE